MSGRTLFAAALGWVQDRPLVRCMDGLQLRRPCPEQGYLQRIATGDRKKKTNKVAIQAAFAMIFGATAFSTHAAVFNTGDILTINSGVATYDSYGNLLNVTSGSWFGCDCNGNYSITGTEKTPLSQGTTGIRIGYVQPAGSAGHAGAPLPTDSNDIDAPWSLLNVTGMQYTTSAVTGDTASGLDFTGWRWR